MKDNKTLSVFGKATPR